MSTHASIFFIEKSAMILHLYRHMDGYPFGHGFGEDLFNATQSRTICDANDPVTEPNFKSYCMSVLHTLPNIELQENFSCDVTYASDGTLTNESIKEIATDNDYTYIVYMNEKSAKPYLAIYNYFDEGIEFHDEIYKVDNRYHYTIEKQEDTLEKRLHLLKDSKFDPILHPVDEIVEKILEDENLTIEHYLANRNYLPYLFLHKDSFTIYFDSYDRSKKMPVYVKISSPEDKNYRKNIKKIVLDVKKEFEENKTAYASFENFD